MIRSLPRISLVCLAALACDTPTDDDAGLVDAGSSDGGMGADAAERDAGRVDAGRDAGGDADGGVDAGPPPPSASIDEPSMDALVAVGESVSFAATCTDAAGAPLSHAWDFGGGAASASVEDPGPVAFATAGSFTVTYTCMGPGGESSDTRTVVVSNPPDGTIVEPAGPIVIGLSDTVDFVSDCVDPDGDTSFTHAWDFGGLSTSTDRSPAGVLFGALGVHTVTYTCTDSTDRADPTPASVTVEVVEPTWIPVVGDMRDSAVIEVLLYDIREGAPGVERSPFPGGWPADADAADRQAVRVDPTGTRLAFKADATTKDSDDLYVVDLLSLNPVAHNVSNVGSGNGVSSYRWAPDGSRLAYAVDSGAVGGHELFVADFAGGLASPTLTRAHDAVTDNLGVATEPTTLPEDGRTMAWSPDSRRVYFMARFGAALFSAYAFDTASPADAATALHGDLGPGRIIGLWAASGSSVVLYGGIGTSRFNMYVSDAAAPSPRSAVRLNATPASAGSVRAASPPFFNAGRDRVAFLSSTEGVGAFELFFVDLSGGPPGADGAAVRVHPELAVGTLITSPQFSATDHLAYLTQERTAGVLELFEVDVSGAGPVNHRPLHPPLPGTARVGRYSWAPDGSGVVYLADVGTDDIDEVHYVAVGAALSAPRVLNPALTTGGEVVEVGPWLSPSSLLYLADGRANDLFERFRADVGTAGSGVLAHAPLTTTPASGFNTLFPMVRSGDGRLVAIGDARERLFFEAFVFNRDATGVSPLHAPLATRFNGVERLGGLLAR